MLATSNSDAKLDKKKRRSKNDGMAELFKCKHCDKTYLSEIALNNHAKTKHAHLVEHINRGRGRPRKNVPTERDIAGFETTYIQFFENSLRKKNDESFDRDKAYKDNFDNLFTKYKEKVFENANNPDDLSFFIENEKSCDFAFDKYLKNAFEFANRDYFDFLFKFVVMFKECINQKKGQTYTRINNADIVPDMCNDFVGEFLEKHKFFGMDVNELINAIQHCCHWLWENHYTTSKLTLMT